MSSQPTPRDGNGPDQEKGPTLSLAAQEQPNHAQRPECFTSTFQECLFVLTATMAIGQQSFYQGCIVGVTASIGADLNMNPAEITWINAGASLSSGAFLLTFGKLADMFGRKALFIIGMAGFSLSLLIAGFATNAIYMDVFSGVLGLFAAAVVPPAVGALGAVYEKPSKRKKSRLCMFQTPLSVSAIRQVDLLGTALVIAGFAFFSSSLTLAGDAPQGWKTGYVLALLIVGVVLLAGFLYWQSIAEYALMPLWVWKDRNFSLLMANFCLGFMGFSAVTFFLSLYLQEIEHLSALDITVRLLPMVVSGVLVNVICGLILHRVSNTLLVGVGSLAYLASFLILSFMKEEALYWVYIFPALVLVVVGADISFNVTNMYVMSSLPPSQQSIAGGIFNTVSKLCNNLGLGIATSISSSMASQKAASTSNIRPYLAVYWFGAACAGLSVLLVPLLTLGTQGGDVQSENEPIVVAPDVEATIRQAPALGSGKS
ncbi:hypothetical protein N7539_004392 [Penicillium diatomitis]|uniref:Major facilitator superfamily (MFS) profile domain-containing protein n=1 Tax=Penicillium diatomitis TaxID=2819901 RepID=A0A9W9XEZ3_9EURO|nr:uncharacterized protein N7539_004392 [Penicillium diatomitis]KAJ5489502.1 hypothetical protein N7539_004392 [Penicillium diatomitis]